MPIYMVSALTNPNEVATAVQEKVQEADRYRLAPVGWLVKHSGTTKELSDLLGVTSDIPMATAPLGSVVITLVGSYYGRAQPDLWEWIRTRLV
jgi:hypothetical protein